MAAVFGVLAARGIPTRAASVARPSLDDVFLRETGRSLRDTGEEYGDAGDRGGGGMTFALQTELFFRRKLLETLRQPVWLVTGLTTPLLYLALFAPLLRSLAGGPAFPPGHVLDVFVPGILVLIAFGAGMGAGWPVIWELDSGVIERLRVTPASRFALLLGTVLRDVVMFAVPGVVVIGDRGRLRLPRALGRARRAAGPARAAHRGVLGHLVGARPEPEADRQPRRRGHRGAAAAHAAVRHPAPAVPRAGMAARARPPQPHVLRRPGVAVAGRGIGAHRHRRRRLPGDRRRGRAGAVVGHPQLPARDGVITPRVR